MSKLSNKIWNKETSLKLASSTNFSITIIMKTYKKYFAELHRRNDNFTVHDLSLFLLSKRNIIHEIAMKNTIVDTYWRQSMT